MIYYNQCMAFYFKVYLHNMLVVSLKLQKRVSSKPQRGEKGYPCLSLLTTSACGIHKVLHNFLDLL